MTPPALSSHLGTPTPLPFETVASRVAKHAAERPDATAVIDDERRISYAELNDLADRIAASLQRDGITPQQAIAICAASRIEYLAVFVGALRAGVVVVPIAPGSTPAQTAAMVHDSGAKLLFVDAKTTATLGPGISARGVPQVALDNQGPRPFEGWLAAAGTRPTAVEIDPAWAFNIIYSSGTTGTPKGIVQPHGMRWAQAMRAAGSGYGPDSVTLISTPLYSNTTLVVVIPTLVMGGAVGLMSRFDAQRYLERAQELGMTHTMLVPVQYARLMALPAFGQFDLSCTQAKFCSSAPFHAELKAEVLERWPGGLTEMYGMTEGGGSCILAAHLHPDKLHTVGQPAIGNVMLLIDERGKPVPQGNAGEIVGRSASMMTGYHNQPEKTAEAEWYDDEDRRHIRTGDIGRFDADGFLILLDRKKDMIISGGFNVHPSDLEAVLRTHPEVLDCAVIGVPSAAWGETPVAAVVLRVGSNARTSSIRDWSNAQLGKTQRLSAIVAVDELPRSAIGKVLKRELREQWDRLAE